MQAVNYKVRLNISVSRMQIYCEKQQGYVSLEYMCLFLFNILK